MSNWRQVAQEKKVPKVAVVVALVVVVGGLELSWAGDRVQSYRERQAATVTGTLIKKADF